MENEKTDEDKIKELMDLDVDLDSFVQQQEETQNMAKVTKVIATIVSIFTPIIFLIIISFIL